MHDNGVFKSIKVSLRQALLGCAACAALFTSPNAGAIVGGSLVDPQSIFLKSVVQIRSYPSLASEMYYSCTGTFISPIAVLTAAHCFGKPAQKVVVIVGLEGDHYKAKLPVNKIEIHPQYSESIFAKSHDLAILSLTSSRNRIAKLGLIALPVYYNEIPVGSVTTAIGFGLESYFLSDAYKPTFAHQTQLQLEATDYDRHELRFKVNEKHGISFGDSGSPALFAYAGKIVVGGVLAKYEMNPIPHQAVYTTIESHVSWINSTVESFAPDLIQ
jgi:secreted trypsin-like serine protease